MAQTRKKVRDSAVAILSHATTGFNARLAALAAGYGVEAFAIDWAAGSESFKQALLDQDGQRHSQLLGSSILICTGNERDGGAGMHRTDLVDLEITIELEFRSGVDDEMDDTESICDAVKEAAKSALRADAAAWDTAVTPDWRSHSVAKQTAEQLGDGYRQVIQILIPCEVDA